MKKFVKKILKYLLILIVGVLITVNAFIILSGRFYLYKGLANTYLIGKSSPTIYDKDVFHSSTLKAGDEVMEFFIHEKYNTQKIPTDFRKFIEELDTRAFLVFKGDTLLYEEYWDEHDKITVSNSFSVAKTLVALLIGIAIDEGKIHSLDDKVAEYIPEFEEGKKNSITIRNLLEMASGLDWEESGVNPLSDNAESYYGTDLYGHVTRQKLITKPGKEFKYQSGNSQLLGFIIEKVSGKTISEYAEEKIWSKLGASGDAYWNLDKENGDEKAFCCLYANARDYSRLGLLILNKGVYNGEQIIPAWFYEEMIIPGDLTTSIGMPNVRYGLHIWTYFGNTNPVYYCRGIKGQYIITIPEEDLLIIRVGLDREPIFNIPENLQNDQTYIEENKFNIGHNTGLFQYIALGKMLASQTKD